MRRVVRAFSVRYSLVLLSLAVLAAFSHLTLTDLIDANRDSGARINVSGRQRMLSQRINLLTDELASTPEGPHRRLLRANLTAAVETMARSHRALVQGDPELGVGPGMTDEQRRRYFGPTTYVDREVVAYLDLAGSVVTADDARLTELVTALRGRREALLVDLDAVVQQYQSEADHLQDRLRTQAATFTSLTLLLLVVSALVVFRPLVRRVSDEMVAISRSRAEQRAILDSALEGVMVTDAQGRIQGVNPMFTTITGYTESEVVGRTPALLHSGRHEVAFYRAMWDQIGRTGSWSGEVWNRRKGGEIYPEWLSISTVRAQDGGVDRYVAMFSDITERKRSEEAIWRRANYDELTHLPKRGLLYDRLDVALAAARRYQRHVGVLFVDLDGFKPINDRLGHHAGDEVLVEVARRLQASVREADTVGRIGGDEFVLALPDIGTTGDVELLVQRVLKNLTAPFWFEGTRVAISASVGVALFPPGGDGTPQLLIEHADQAMYQAKRAGGGRAAFWSPGSPAPEEPPSTLGGGDDGSRAASQG